MTEGFQGPFQNAISKGGSFMSTNEKGTPQSRTYTLDLEALVEQLRNSPELANTLAALLASAPSEK